MSAARGILEVAAFGFVLWPGLFLLARDGRNPRLRFAGLGLIAFAIGLAGDIFSRHALANDATPSIARLLFPAVFLPPVFWFGATLTMLPDGHRLRNDNGRLVRWGIPTGALAVYILAAVFIVPAGARSSAASITFGGIVLAPLLAAVVIAIASLRRPHGRPASAGIVVAGIFFGLGLGLLLLPTALLPRSWLILGLAIDLELFAIAVAGYDALEAGEAFRQEFLRSLAAAGLLAFLFGGQIALVMVLATGLTPPMLLLLLTVVAGAVALQAFSEPLESAIDRLVFRGRPTLQQARADLRRTATALPRAAVRHEIERLDEQEFARLVRRALSNYGDLPRLAASPLAQLGSVTERLAARGAADNTLERAAELKSLLDESIERLKPRDKGEFGTSDEWRFYNALYFPYVRGLKPFSRRNQRDGSSPPEREALDWFRSQVPERTLHNWQTQAARLIARDLRERSD